MPRKKNKKKSSRKSIEKKIPEDLKVDDKIVVKSDDNEKLNNNLISEVENLDNTTMKTKLLELENENTELKATIEKARKKLRIYSKKLDLSEEREEQWKVACYNIAGIFAEKSHVSLDDILKRFEAPLEDSIAI